MAVEQAVPDSAGWLAAALLDGAGQLIAVNAEWRRLAGNVEAGSNLSEVTKVPELAAWVSSHTGRSQAIPARQDFHFDNCQLSAQLLALPGLTDAAQHLLLIAAQPAGPLGEDPAARLRHDIKNRIGGLKLYATFLKRKLGEHPELLEVVGKMIDSLDQMTAEANKIKFSGGAWK